MDERGSLFRYTGRVIIRRIVYVVIGVIIASIVGAFATATGASAAPPPGYVRPAPPASNYKYGVPAAQLQYGAGAGACCGWVQNYAFPADGGWSFGGGANMTVSTGNTGTTVSSLNTPVAVILGEPIVPTGAAASSLAGTLQVPFRYEVLTDPRTGASASSFAMNVTPPNSYFLCQDTEWALPSAQRKSNQSSGASPSPGINSRATNLLGGPVVAIGGAIANRCPFVAGIVINFRTYQGATGSTPGAAVDSSVIWTADNWYRATNYYAPVDPQQQICRVGGVAVSDQCPFILGSAGGIDGTDPAQVCGNAPTPAWLNFDWLNKWVFYMGQCMFRPANGFDRGSWITTAWTTGAGGSIQTSLNTVSHAFDIAESCGLLIGGSSSLPGFTVDTCSWSAWSPVKVVIGVGISAAFGLWLIQFLLGLVFDVLNRKIRSPMATEADA